MHAKQGSQGCLFRPHIHRVAERLSSQTRVTVEQAKSLSTSAPRLSWPSSKSAKQGKTMTRHCEGPVLLAALDASQHGVTPLRRGTPAAS